MLRKPQFFILLFILTYIIIDFTFIYISEKSYNGVVTQNAYNKGLKYNSVLNEAKKQNNHIFDVSYVYHDNALTIQLVLKDNKGMVLKGIEAKGVLFRPTNSGVDINFEFIENESGIYRATIYPKFRGQWDLRIHGYYNNEKLYHSKRIHL